MDVMNLVESILRWFHVFAGILWVGHLYFFNFVHANFAPTMDAETKRKVLPELMPRALFWFRMGAALTWVTGFLLLGMVYHMGGMLFADPDGTWGPAAGILTLVVFLAPLPYDALYKGPLKDPRAGLVAGFVLSALIVVLMDRLAGFSFRAYAIHLGTMYGTIMAFNVWFRIWPAQRQIVTAVKNGEAPPADLVALAATRSMHNTYLSAPLLFTMIGQHAAGNAGPLLVIAMIVLGWGTVAHLYARAKAVKGF